MAHTPSASLSQFQGTLLGVLVGDALGHPFEFVEFSGDPKTAVQQYFFKLTNSKEKDFKKFTDDSSMTISLGLSLLECRGLTILNLARRFTHQYFTEGDNRCYGGSIGATFRMFRQTNFVDPFKIAALQFEGQGSLGNGGGMRLAPLALFTASLPDSRKLVEMVIAATRLTHAHPLGIAGAVFQAISIRQALIFGSRRLPEEKNHSKTQATPILATIKQELHMLLEESSYQEYLKNSLPSYINKIEIIEKFLQDGRAKVSRERVIRELGTGVTALDSIPTALYCFLNSFEDVQSDESQFQDTIEYAIHLGGDTDTIGSMAGGIAGAYLGVGAISKRLSRHCEGVPMMLDIGAKLHNYHYMSKDLIYAVL